MQPQRLLLRSLILVWFLLGTAAAAVGQQELPADAVATEIQKLLAAPGSEVRVGERALAAEPLRGVYAKRKWAPAWSDGHQPSERLDTLLRALVSADAEGLRPDSYAPKALAAARAAAEKADPPDQPGQMARLDLLATDALLRYGSDLQGGQVDPGAFDPDWLLSRQPSDVATRVEQALAGPTLEPALAALPPPFAGYALLRDALAQYRDIAAAGGWLKVPDGPPLQPGQPDPRVPALRQRLAATGDLVAADLASEVYDDSVQAGLKHFQVRHGLTPDAVLGARTMIALNVPVEDRIRELALNMERWRWLPRTLEASHIAVNLASATLELVQDGRAAMSMRVVVGDAKNPTPSLRDRIVSVVINPPWNVPYSIATKEMLPLLKKNPNYLARNNIRIVTAASASESQLDAGDQIEWKQYREGNFPFRLRQDPGAANSLGRLKFNTTNAQNIYLHDTPSRKLFGRDSRALSHGCVRVEQPMQLALQLMGDQSGWSEAKIKAAISAGSTRSVPLGKSIPVYLLYYTAWVAADGTLNFRDDVYSRDTKLAQAIDRRQPSNPVVAGVAGPMIH